MKLARHTLFWVSAGIVLDYATSWAMMYFIRPTAEGSVVTRDFYVHPTIVTLSALLESQVPQIVIFGGALVSYLFFCVRPKFLEKLISESSKTLLMGFSVIAWLVGGYRFARGPTSNLSAFVTNAYGQQAGENIFNALFLIAIVVVFADLFIVILGGPRRPKS